MSIDLKMSYLGITLRNPLIVAACPLTAHLQMLKRLEDGGAAAAVVGSLYAEQIDFERAEYGSPASLGVVAQPPLWAHGLSEYNSGPDSYLRHIAAAKEAVSIPIIGSLNAAGGGDWIDFARLIQQVGADALELNIYSVPSDPQLSGSEIEERYVEMVAAVRAQISIPLAVKIGPFFTSLPHLVHRLIAAGADGLVLFNRFLQPDIDLASMEVTSKLMLSSRDELRLPLRWIGILSGQVSASLAASTGIHTAEDVVKLVLAGADAMMLASALIEHGPAYLNTLLDDLTAWLALRGCTSLQELKGLLSQHRCANAGAFERADYARALTEFAG